MYEKLLVPLDGSEVSELILPYAIELAKRCGAHVTLLETVESVEHAMATMAPAEPVLVTPEATESIIEGIEGVEEDAKHYLARVASQFSARGLQTDWVVLSGSPGVEIIRFVEERGMDVIAMSSHGRGGIERAIFGSVTDHVLRHAAVPVLVLRYREPHK